MIIKSIADSKSREDGKMKVVIANSVGVDKEGNYIIHSPSRWTVGVKDKFAWFAYYPWELAYLSTLLKQKTDFDVKMVDGCLLKLDFEEYYKVIASEKPDWLVMESSSRTIVEDLKLAMKLKNNLGTKLIFTGQHPTAFPESVLSLGADYVCLGEYELTVLELLKTGGSYEIIGVYPNECRPLLDINTLPFPEDSDVSRMAYAFPGEPNCDYREIQMYASRGCRMQCVFCVAAHLYYIKPNWRPRKITNIIDEISLMKSKYPLMEGIFFDEETHNGERKFVITLCNAIIDNKLDSLRYNAMCGYWTMDDSILEAMKRAGYYKLRFGIETASEKVAKEMNKPIDIDKITGILKKAKSLKIKTYGTFTIGAPGSNKFEDQKTVNLITKYTKEHILDGLQVSINTPQPGTPFYNWVEAKGYIKTFDWKKYDGATCAVISYPDYTNDEIESMFKKACAIRDHFVLKQKLSVEGSIHWLKRNIKNYGFLDTLRKALIRVKTELFFRRRENHK
jgi:anaerobic magnesium-protoporphyrin IX monomethyl ester cyclase